MLCIKLNADFFFAGCRATHSPNELALTGYGLLRAGIKSLEKIWAAIIRPRPYILFELLGRPVWPGPFWQL